MRHRRPLPRRCSPEYHRRLPARKMAFNGILHDGTPGYPPMKLYDCRRCRTTVVRARPGRCNDCNEPTHHGQPCP